VLKLLYDIKGADGIILISDSTSAAGMPEGDYSFKGESVFVRDGAVRLHDGTLAGSTLALDKALKNFITATGRPLPELIPCSSTNAAAAIALGNSKGRVAAGFDADLILVDADLNVKMTMVSGNVVYSEI
jgi:N-acetylglucosamine-6-phosphate deacetylase